MEKLTADLHVVLDNTLGGRACRYMPTVALSSTAISKNDNGPMTFYRYCMLFLYRYIVIFLALRTGRVSRFDRSGGRIQRSAIKRCLFVHLGAVSSSLNAASRDRPAHINSRYMVSTTSQNGGMLPICRLPLECSLI